MVTSQQPSENHAISALANGIIHPLIIHPRKTSVAIEKDKAKRLTMGRLPKHDVVLGPIEVGRESAKQQIIDEAFHIQLDKSPNGISRILHISLIAHPIVEVAPFRDVAILLHHPPFDDVDLIEVDIIMVFKIAFVRRLLQSIDAPLLTVDKHHRLAHGQTLHIEMGSHTMRQVVLTSRLQPVATTERMQT